MSSFDWDQWNIQKNESKHGVSRLEAESAFYDPSHQIYEDLKHSQKEARWLLLGLSIESRVLFLGFTYRREKIRIITARSASKKEREVYEKNKK